MGFDIDCIIDIHSYPGEYFCPVCRTLVYPNEAFQAQCTHLYCKPCLVHIANGRKACPYDGYLVTESDSKPLTECNKALTEKIGEVRVHCLYFRSGCPWEGTLSDCPSHYSGCPFGNSPVICNRCGIQMLHHQVHDHAPICPAVVGAAGVNNSGTNSTPVTAQANQTVALSGAPVTQPHNPQYVSATQLPGQNLQNANTLANASAPAQVVPPTAVPAPNQWYQQQYQQYPQQYVGYDPYQQQQYYPPQQTFQQYQQYAMQVQGQHQSNAYAQAQAQARVQGQPQGTYPYLPLQPPQQTPASRAARQSQSQGQAQPHSQPQLHMLPPAQAQSELPNQGQTQENANVQALPPNYLVKPQQEAHPAMRPETQILLQGLPPPPPPRGPSSQPPQFPQPVGMRSHAFPQYQQAPQYQQVSGQMHHPQGSQAHLQPPLHPQTDAYAQSSRQSNSQSLPQTQLYVSNSQFPISHSQTNQIAAPSALLQAPHPPLLPVSGNNPYQQPQTEHTMHPGASQQLAVLPHPPSGSTHPVQVYGQVPHQSPHSHATSHNYAQQQQISAPFHGQAHQQGNLQQPPQSQIQMHPSGLPKPQHSKNYAGIPSLGMPPKSHLLPSGDFGTSGCYGPTQGDSTLNQNQNQNYEKSTAHELNVTVQDIRSPSKVVAEKVFEGDYLKEEAGTGLNGAFVMDADDSVKDGVEKFSAKQKKSDLTCSREPANEGKTFGAGGVEKETPKEEVTLSNSVPLKRANPDNRMKVSNTVRLSSSNFGGKTISANSASSAEGHTLPPISHGSLQESSKEQSSSRVGLQGLGALPHPGQLVNLTGGKMDGNVGGPSKSFESATDAHDFMGNPPPPPFKSQFGSQDVVRPGEGAMPSGHMSGSGDWHSLTKIHAEEGNHFRMNGAAAHEPSMLDARNVNSKSSFKEYLNPFERKQTRIFDQVSRFLDKPFHGHGYGVVSKMDPGVSGSHSRVLPHHQSGDCGDMLEPRTEFGRDHRKRFLYHSPGKDYLGSASRGFRGPSSFPRGTLGFDSREAHRFGVESSNLSSDFSRNPFHDDKTLHENSHRVPDLLHNQIDGDDVSGPDQLMKGKFSGSGYLTGHGRAGEGSGNFLRPPSSESVRGDMPSVHHREPPIGNKYPYHGMSNAGHFPGVVDHIDQSRKRKPLSIGWCRICEVDCVTVDRLDMHSQTRDHQHMAMDIVKRISLQNKKKPRASGGHMIHGGGGSKNRNVTTAGHGKKP